LVGALAVMVLWGASPVVTKIATGHIDPLLVGLLRTTLAGLLAGPILLAMRQALPARRDDRVLLAISSLSGFVLFPILFTLGQQHTSATHGGMILAALPIVTGSYVAITDRRRPELRWFLGCGIALVGEAGIVLLRAGGHRSGATVGGDALVIVSALIVSAGYVAGARLGERGYRSLATTFWGVALGAIIGLPLLGYQLVTGPAIGRDAGSWAAVVFMAVFTTIIGYVGWYWALAKGGIARIATVQFLQPFSGLVLAVLLLGEPFTLPLAIAAAAILGGVSLAQRPR
jgi:drug/metabolite transporter (DMT)-like permease